MSDDLPGFIDDEPKPAAKPATAKPPAAKPAAAPSAAFNPFADVKVSLDPSAAPATAAEPAAKAGGAPGTGRAAKVGAKPAPVPDPGDADIAPGQGKDLWSCPHCGARNKPGRDTCRSCGKTPSDTVETPWHAQPAARLGIAAGAIVVIALLGWLVFGGGDVELAPADAAHVDGKPRFGKRSDGVTDVAGGKRFVAERHVALCGRVLAALPGPDGTTETVFVLGKDATDEAGFAALAVEGTGSDLIVRPEPRMRIAYLLSGDATVATPARGAWLSVLGSSGFIEQDGQRSHDFEDGDLIIRVDATAP